MGESKPFVISKRVVYETYPRVVGDAEFGDGHDLRKWVEGLDRWYR